jgi:hypothetical protein
VAQSVDLIFSDFAPDRGGAPWPENPGYLVDAINVRFTPNGYRTTYLDQYATVTPATIPAAVLFATGFASSTTPRHYAATQTKIYESDDYGATWYDNAGAAYGATDWDIALYGSTVIAVNAADNPQAKSLTAAVANNFADLGGTPPKAARVARIRDSLVLGQTATDTYGLQWSSIGDPTDWPTPGSATALARQAGAYSMQTEHGVITQLVGGEKFGLVFQERAITRMTYVGGDIQFTFDVYEKGQGTGFNHSVIRIGSLFYFQNSTGVWATDGYTVTPISLGKVDDSFIRNILSHPNGAASFRDGVAYDHRTHSICWPFIRSDNNSFLLCYDIAMQQFKTVDSASEILTGTLYSVTNGASQKSASAIPHMISGSLQLEQFAKLDTVPTTYRTGFVELAPGLRSSIQGIEVLGAGMSVSPLISVRSEDDTTDLDLSTDGYDTATKSIRTNNFTVLKSGRFHSFQYRETAQHQAALIRGLRVYYEVTGQK